MDEDKSEDLASLRERAARWDEVVELAGQEHMTSSLLGSAVRQLVNGIASRSGE